ncbi:MAG: mandelate racemase [Verrucomicrobia bacterium]|nr:mandelate racemase [Verrucomicrobiota bacterium]
MTRIENVFVETIRLRADYCNAAVSFAELTGSVVAIVADRGDSSGPMVGFGFGSIGRYAHSEMIRERFARRLLVADPAEYNDTDGLIDPNRMGSVMRRNEKPGGHGERTAAIGAVDMAAWDLLGKLEHSPLYRTLAKRFNGGEYDSAVAVYAAGGYYYEGDGLARLQHEIISYLETGYQSVKIKVGGVSIAEDLKRIDAVIDIVGSPTKVAVDANGRFEKAEALEWAKALEPLGLCWFEEPVDPLDFDGLRAVTEEYPLALATGENLFSKQDVKNLMCYGGMRSDRDLLQMDPGLSYGLPEYVIMLDYLESLGWSRRQCIPHGGSLFNLHVAQGLKIGGTEAYPGVFEPLGGFGELVAIEEGKAQAPELPGIGWESKPELMECFRKLGKDGQITF